MAVKVFVSHSTWLKKDLPERLREQIPAHVRFREAVRERLRREPGFDVLIDEDIPTGTHWRELLFGRMADCDAAVILVNEQALLHSPWVDTEARILGWRAWLDRENFRLVMILFGGVTRERLAEHSDWEAIAPAELKMVPMDPNGLDITDAAAVGSALDETVAAIRPLASDGTVETRGSRWIVGRLTALLAFKAAALRQLAQRANVKTPVAVGDPQLQRAIARQLYELGPKGLRYVLESPLVKANHDDLVSLLDLLSTYWIHPCASASMLKFRDATSVQHAFAINGALAYFTPQAYVQNVCGSSAQWPIIQVDVKRTVPEIVAQVRAGLADKFRPNLKKTLGDVAGASDDLVDVRLNELLGNRLEQGSGPVFVALPPAAAGDTRLINALTGKYRNLRIILCSGRPPGTPSLPGVETIRPEIELEQEQAAWKEYDAMLSEIPP